MKRCMNKPSEEGLLLVCVPGSQPAFQRTTVKLRNVFRSWNDYSIGKECVHRFNTMGKLCEGFVKKL